MRILKNFFFLVCLFGLANGSSAQGISIGLAVGMNRSSIVQEEGTAEQERLNGVSIGIPIELALSRSLAVRLEPTYSQKGTRNVIESKDQTFTSRSEEELRLNYLELPLLAEYTFDLNRIGIAVAAGATADMARNGDYSKIEQEWRDNKLVYNVIYVQRGFRNRSGAFIVRRYDFGMILGAGLRYRLKRHTLSLDLRYRESFFNWDRTPFPLVEKNRMRHQGVSISLGYLIKLGNK